MPRNNMLTNAVTQIGAVTIGGLLRSLKQFGDFWIFGDSAASFIPRELVTVRGWRRFLTSIVLL